MPSDVSITEIRRLLEQYGWSLARIRGSHHIFTGPGGRPTISVPVHRRLVKYVYKFKIEKIIQSWHRPQNGHQPV